jgi:hypothetical protein
VTAVDPAARHPRLNAFFFFVVGVMLAHEAEHVAQVAQKDVLGASCPNDCRGLLGFMFDVEWVHAAYNDSLLVLLVAIVLAYRMWLPEWRRTSAVGWWALLLGVFLIQGYHVVEHSIKLAQWLDNGHRSPTPGLLGQVLPPPSGHNFSLIELHFTINTLVLVCVLVGYFGLGFHRHLVPRSARLYWAAAVVVLVLLGAGGAYAWTKRPPTVHLASGFHAGPIVLDRAERLVGADGATVRGPLRIRANDVIVRNVTIVGGEYGVEVDGASQVLLDDVTIRGAALDGIHVRRGSVIVRDCAITTSSPYGQGIDISFSFDRLPSTVEGCAIQGGQEGIVSDFAMVTIRRNEVSGTSLRAITTTEMSMGMVKANDVHDALGVGIWCGDYSECEIEDNRVSGTRADSASGDRTRIGYGVVAQLGAHAHLRRNLLNGNAGGRAAAFVGARLERAGDES